MLDLKRFGKTSDHLSGWSSHLATCAGLHATTTDKFPGRSQSKKRLINYSITATTNDLRRQTKSKRLLIYQGIAELQTQIQQSQESPQKSEKAARNLLLFLQEHYKDVFGFQNITAFLEKLIFCDFGYKKKADCSVEENINQTGALKLQSKRSMAGLTFFDKEPKGSKANLKRIFREEAGSAFDTHFASRINELRKVVPMSSVLKLRGGGDGEGRSDEHLPAISLGNQASIPQRSVEWEKSNMVLSHYTAIPSNLPARNQLAEDPVVDDQVQGSGGPFIPESKAYKHLYEGTIRQLVAIKKQNQVLKNTNVALRYEIKILKREKEIVQQRFTDQLNLKEIDLQLLPRLRREKFEMTVQAMEAHLMIRERKNRERDFRGDIDALLKKNVQLITSEANLRARSKQVEEQSVRQSALLEQNEKLIERMGKWKAGMAKKLRKIEAFLTGFEKDISEIYLGGQAGACEKTLESSRFRSLSKSSIQLREGSLDRVSSLRVLNDTVAPKMMPAKVVFKAGKDSERPGSKKVKAMDSLVQDPKTGSRFTLNIPSKVLAEVQPSRTMIKQTSEGNQPTNSYSDSRGEVEQQTPMLLNRISLQSQAAKVHRGTLELQTMIKDVVKTFYQIAEATEKLNSSPLNSKPKDKKESNDGSVAN